MIKKSMKFDFLNESALIESRKFEKHSKWTAGDCCYFIEGGQLNFNGQIYSEGGIVNLESVVSGVLNSRSKERFLLWKSPQ
jgi:hypothetical protein